MVTENLSTLKIHKLSQAQYDREYEAGNIDENALYLTPEEEIDLSGYATKDDLDGKADADHTHEEYATVVALDTLGTELGTELDGKADADHTHITSSGGFAGGTDSSATVGGAVGKEAVTTFGGAVGYKASASDWGGAVGYQAVATKGFSGGYNAQATVDAIQIGEGTNEAAKTLQVYDKQLMNGDGMIPFARYAKFVQGTTSNTLEANTIANNHTVYSETSSSTNPGSVIVVPILRSAFNIVATVRYHMGQTIIQVTRPVGMDYDSVITEYYIDYWIFSESPIE